MAVTVCVEKERFDRAYADALHDGKLLYVGKLLQRAAIDVPNQIVLRYGDTALTYQELYARAYCFSQSLQKKGVKPRDRVIILLENSIEFYVAYFGVLQIGAVVVPLNIFLTESEVTYVVKDAGPAAMVVSSSRLNVMQDAIAPLVSTILTEKECTAVSCEVSEGIHVELGSHECAVLLYTSGTTGLPKGVMLSSENIMTNVLQCQSRFIIEHEDRVLAVLPLFHSFAQSTCIWLPFYLQCSIIIVPKIDRRALATGLSYKPTMFVGVPALYGLLCLLKTAPLESVKLFISGGDALSDKIRIGFALLYGRKICVGYGLTEASPVVTVDLEDTMEVEGVIGRPLIGIDCAFKDEQGQDVPDGQVGELWIAGDNIMLGYYNAPEATTKTMSNGWLKTGDLAYRNTAGKLVLVGRCKELIIHKGFNIYPPEIENRIMTHPAVIRVGVIGRKDPDTGEVAIAYVQVKKGTGDCSVALKKICKELLAAYKVPREFICVETDLPLTATGKVNKKKIKDLDSKK